MKIQSKHSTPRNGGTKRFGRRAAGSLIAVVALMAGAVAFAAWTSSGTGTGTATARNAQALTVNVTNVSGLYPTGSMNVPFTVTNPNPYAVTLNKVVLN